MTRPGTMWFLAGTNAAFLLMDAGAMGPNGSAWAIALDAVLLALTAWAATRNPA